MTSKQIINAQGILRKLESTPVRVTTKEGLTFWQVTYDNNTYNKLIGLISYVANQPIREIDAVPNAEEYHRERI